MVANQPSSSTGVGTDPDVAALIRAVRAADGYGEVDLTVWPRGAVETVLAARDKRTTRTLKGRLRAENRALLREQDRTQVAFIASRRSLCDQLDRFEQRARTAETALGDLTAEQARLREAAATLAAVLTACDLTPQQAALVATVTAVLNPDGGAGTIA